MAKKTKKTVPATALKKELASSKKMLNLMNIELEVYREIGGLAVKGYSKNFILSRLMDFALKALKTCTGTLYLIDANSEDITLEVVKGPGAGGQGRKTRCGSVAAALVARTGKPYVSADGSKGPGACMAVPLMIKKKTAGVIEVGGKRGGGDFTGADLKTLSSLANHFSIIMERANLFTELDDRIKQLSTLNTVGNLLISTLDQTVIRHMAMEAVTRLMRAETGSLLLVDRKKKELYFEVALGEKGRKLKEIRLNIGEGIAGWVAKHGKPLIIQDVSADKRFQGSFDKKSKFVTRNMVCVPVKIKGNVIGVLQAINSTGGPFEPEDLNLFQLFSNQVAIALDNARLYEEIKETFYATSEALAEAIEKRDPYTGGHTKRVLEYSLAIAREMKLPQSTVEILKLSAVLHDIGKIGIEDSILRKNAPLDPSEAAAMKTHPLVGAEILSHVPQLKDVVPGMLYHHERVDGDGYPKGLKHDRIPLIARIISVADTYDAMTTARPYRGEFTPEMAMKELKKHSGRQFDGKVVNAFIRAYRNGSVGPQDAGKGKNKIRRRGKARQLSGQS
jgi:HD-GYP domain-containing protein (c-di-GMP phosphodiesterase class II)